MKKVSLLTLMTTLLLLSQATGQVKTKSFFNGLPDSLLPIALHSVPTTRLAVPDSFYLIKKNFAQNRFNIRPNKIAFSVKEQIDVMSFKALTLKDGSVMYYGSILAEGALNINCEFSAFYIPKGVTLTIFTDYEITDSIDYRQKKIIIIGQLEFIRGTNSTSS